MARGECPPHSPWVGVPFHPSVPLVCIFPKAGTPDGIQSKSRLSSSICSHFLPFSSLGPHPAASVTVKLIIAIIQPNKLEAVKEALTKVEVFRLTVMDCQGFGRQKGQTGVYRGHEFSVNLLRKVQLQIAVNEQFVQPTIDAILEGGRTGEAGEIGDGKIFVLPMDDCIRIRTGERGGEAI